MPCIPDTAQNRVAAGEALRRGGVAAFATDTLYALGAQVFDAAAVARVFTIKGRPPDQGLPVLVGGIEQMAQVAEEVSEQVLELARHFWPGPLTLVLRRHPQLPGVVTGGRATVAVRRPDHPAALALIEACGSPLTGTSANVSGGPLPRSAQEVIRQLGDSVDLILDSGPCTHGIPSTILDMTSSPARVLRAGALPVEEVQRFCPVAQEPAFPAP